MLIPLDTGLPVYLVLAQWYSAGLRAGWSGVRVMDEAGNFSLYHRVQTGSGAHPASYPVGTKGSLSGGDAYHSPPSISEVKECVELYLHSSVRLHGVVPS
jgi:hypothetical protein